MCVWCTRVCAGLDKRVCVHVYACSLPCAHTLHVSSGRHTRVHTRCGCRVQDELWPPPPPPRLRYLVKQLETGEVNVEELKRNLECAASLLEAVYIDETRCGQEPRWQAGHGGHGGHPDVTVCPPHPAGRCWTRRTSCGRWARTRPCPPRCGTGWRPPSPSRREPRGGEPRRSP
uniref:Uncharacterized protein n=1 Tax=Otus sunia TaxID=257818 RepID=A0A8C8ABA4_9STRI